MTIRSKRLSVSGLAVVLALAAISLACRPPREGHGETDPDAPVTVGTVGEEESPQAPGAAARLVVSSPAFEAGGEYPAEFTCDGASASPPLEWSGGPAGTRCYALNVW